MYGKISEKFVAEDPICNCINQMGWNCQYFDQLKDYQHPLSKKILFG